MKRISFIIAAFFLLSTINAQDMKQIKLPAPNKTTGTAIMKALNDRHSERGYAANKLLPQDISNLLWAANGLNRPDGKRTAPSWHGRCKDVAVVPPKGHTPKLSTYPSLHPTKQLLSVTLPHGVVCNRYLSPH